MTAVRSRRQHKQYTRHQQYVEPPQKGCVFCTITGDSPQFISEMTHFRVIHNIFPYTLWDSQRVTDHLLVVPKLHTDSLAELPGAGAREFVQTISTYESRGYNVWARAPKSVLKSIDHQHTHLIKLSGRKIKFLVYLRRPYLRMLLK